MPGRTMKWMSQKEGISLCFLPGERLSLAGRNGGEEARVAKRLSVPRSGWAVRTAHRIVPVLLLHPGIRASTWSVTPSWTTLERRFAA